MGYPKTSIDYRYLLQEIAFCYSLLVIATVVYFLFLFELSFTLFRYTIVMFIHDHIIF